MRASLTVDTSSLKALIAKYDPKAVGEELDRIIQSKAVAAMVGQAIADNFKEQGPGWQPLKGSTIRRSVSKKLKKSLSSLTDKGIEMQEALARKSGNAGFRTILRRTGLLMQSATTPGARGNIFRKEQHAIVFGTDLIYAGVHNRGLTIKHPGTDKGFGIKGLKIPPHDIKMPKRKFMRIRKEWHDRIVDFVAEQCFKMLVQRLIGGQT